MWLAPLLWAWHGCPNEKDLLARKYGQIFTPYFIFPKLQTPFTNKCSKHVHYKHIVNYDKWKRTSEILKDVLNQWHEVVQYES